MSVQERNQELVSLLTPDFQGRAEPQFAWKSVVSQYLALPALRGFWPMSSVDYAAASQGRDIAGGAYHLTNNNSADFGYSANSLIPQVDVDGTNQYLSRADGGAANWADIRGNEAYITAAQQGLTIMCWVKYDDETAAAAEYVACKFGAAGQRSYALTRAAGAGGVSRFIVSGDGTALLIVSDATDAAADTWYFLAGRFIPSTSIDLFVNPSIPTDFQTLAAGIPATVFDSTAPFTVGATGVPGNYLDGQVSMVALCAAALNDATIWQCYQQSRVMFNA